MANNIKYVPGNSLSVVVTDPVAPNAGDPCRYKKTTGIALTKIGDGGNDATKTTVFFGGCVCTIPVTGTLGNIAEGDALFYDDAIHGVNNNANAYPFGFALAAVASGATTTIDVNKTETVASVSNP